MQYRNPMDEKYYVTCDGQYNSALPQGMKGNIKVIHMYKCGTIGTNCSSIDPNLFL